MDLAQLHARVRDSIAHDAGGIDDEAALGRLIALLGYVDGDYNNAGTFKALKRDASAARSAPPTILRSRPRCLGPLSRRSDARAWADGARVDRREAVRA